jgi:hypothetical protein
MALTSLTVDPARVNSGGGVRDGDDPRCSPKDSEDEESMSMRGLESDPE